eukprot:CAMPEP_0183366420 /NCGR_PEP_ID=MMETSP0164_2-20130417/88547_1 /TAXON_ID=221442 /ORGANISM="Coccolithus pelagicus ssp braarudi, Strain PLY182g" /LENGTH=73 /DNA_ID=CAMNT_0025542143 /DNA_START=118 /DNA_END=335 /DNA_ORIENTATION=-
MTTQLPSQGGSLSRTLPLALFKQILERAGKHSSNSGGRFDSGVYETAESSGAASRAHHPNMPIMRVSVRVRAR